MSGVRGMKRAIRSDNAGWISVIFSIVVRDAKAVGATAAEEAVLCGDIRVRPKREKAAPVLQIA